ncbi:MAG: hypothetical protein HQ541_16560 [Mariniphaga sp.]|nr:hypothetical protein [Mariniphaga sp.]
MKKVITLIIIPLFIIVISCEKDDPQTLYEKVLIVETRSVNETESQRFFVLIENNESSPVFKEIPNYSEYTFIRNGLIKGDKVNIHLISLNTFSDQHYFNINSYSSVPVGKTVLFGRDNILNDKSASSRVDLEFTNIPDFDIATRSAHLQIHCHTQTTFVDVPCEPIGGNTFPVNETFYACLQKGDVAGFKLQKITTTEDSYTISLDSLNNNMDYYELPKEVENHDLTKISVRAFDPVIGTIEIFNLSDISIFPSAKIDFFVPAVNLSISNYIIDYTTLINNKFYKNVFSTETIISTPTLIDAELQSGSEINHQLDFTVSGNLDFLTVRLNNLGSNWLMHGIDPGEMYIPEFPEDLIAITGEPGFLEDVETASIQLYDYSELNGYNNALEKILDDSKKLMDSTNQSYTTLYQNVTYNH